MTYWTFWGFICLATKQSSPLNRERIKRNITSRHVCFFCMMMRVCLFVYTTIFRAGRRKEIVDFILLLPRSTMTSHSGLECLRLRTREKRQKTRFCCDRGRKPIRQLSDTARRGKCGSKGAIFLGHNLEILWRVFFRCAGKRQDNLLCVVVARSLSQECSHFVR